MALPVYAAGTLRFLASDVVGTTRVFSTPFAPKAFVVHAQGLPDLGQVSTTINWRPSIGVASSPSKRHVSAGMSQDAFASSSCWTRQAADFVAATVPVGGASFNGAIDLDAMLSSGGRFIVDVQLPVDFLLSILAIGGDEVEADVHTHTFGASGSDTSAPFAPDAAILVGFAGPTALPFGGSSFLQSFGVGIRDRGGIITQGSLANLSADSLATMDTGHYVQLLDFWSRLQGGPIAVNGRHRLDSFLANGFSYTGREVPFAQIVGVLVLKGVRGKVVGVKTKTVTGVAIPVSAGLPGGAAVVFGGRVNFEADDVAGDNAGYSLGFATAAGQQIAQGALDEDAVADSAITLAALTADEGCYVQVDPGAVGAKAKASRWTPDGLELEMTQADGAETDVAVLVLEGEAPTSQPARWRYARMEAR